jgi:eukaryotic-like serine/threonine-protein kinase
MVGEVIADRYELEELVGSGGMSSVFRARDRLLDRHVALKVLHPHYAEDGEYVERFRREARAVARLSHPNIVTVIDRGESDGRQFIVFEYVDGENLKQVLEETGPLPVRDALELALGVARGLAFAHDHGLVHRDVKPQNVLLNGDGRPKVTDFGIARSLDIEHGVTQTGTVLGTSNYIAPEQASGGRVDAQTDVYGLGVLLFELLTDEVPFEGDNFVAIAMRHINEPPPSVLERRGDVPPRVAAAVDRALAKDPRQRFPSMDAFAAELEACIAELNFGSADPNATLVVTPQRTVRPQRARRRTSPWPLLLALLALLALGVIVVAAIALHANVGSVVPDIVKPKKAAKLVAVNLTAQHSFDPYGDDRQEHDSEVGAAVDGDPSTYWLTSRYHYPEGGLGKPGVGFVVRAAGSGGLKRMTVVTDTPGFTAQIKASSSSSGGFDAVSGSKVVGSSTTFKLDANDGPYYLVWITRLPTDVSSAHVNEVKAAR